jgi:bifunctional DNA-binding transcriptional regulator/antitoxin component of YhaV-PrlF toxin-antitoxin module
MTKKWTIDLIEDGDDLVLTIPDEIMQEQGWVTGDMLRWYDNGDGSWSISKKEIEVDEKANLEKDIKDCQYIVDKVRSDDVYAQSLYAALCNNHYHKNDFVLALKGENGWYCSWRYAGGIIADIQCKGSYMDWYCSGGEGDISDEVAEDLKKIGWIGEEIKI